MAITRPSSDLKDKINVVAVGIRKQEATAEDFIELGNILNEIIDEVEAIDLSTTSNPYYGKYTTLANLQAAHTTAELNAWAIIDAGTGITPQIASWDNTNSLWEIAGYTSNNISVNTFSLLPNPGTENITYLTKDTGYLYQWYNTRYNLVGGNAPVEVRIQGALVETYGKTDLANFEDNDKFRYWYNNSRYYAGIILDATSISLPTDLTDKNKIALTANQPI